MTKFLKYGLIGCLVLLFTVIGSQYVYAQATGGCGGCESGGGSESGGNQGGGEDRERPDPICTISATPKTVTKGDAVKLTWTTSYANTASIAGIGGVSVGSGSKTVYPTKNTKYTMTVSRLAKSATCAVSVVVEQPQPEVIKGCTDADAINYNEKATEDDGSCEYEVVEIPGCTDADAINYNPEATEDNGSCEYPEPPEVGECKLSVEKWVNAEVADMGAPIAYTINVKNIGTADCTGGGVIIRDHLATNFVYDSYSITGDISAGYEGNPVYDATAHSMYFNGHTLTPNERGTIKINGHIATVNTCEDFTIENQAKATARELNNFTEWAYSNIVKTRVEVPACEQPVYGCTDADALNYKEEATHDDGSCEYETETPAPICESFSANVDRVAHTGGDVTLTWDTTNATRVTIYPHLGVVETDGTDTAFISASTKFLLTATNAAGTEVTCEETVLVDPTPEVFTCANNVLFTAGDTSLTEGQSTTIDWTVTGADSATVSVINATSLTGSRSVSPANDTTYTLSATKGSNTISCPLTISVADKPSSGGGGGGGTATVRCDLDASKTKIKSGDSVRLSWDTSNAREVILTDDDGKVVFTTDDFLSSEKDDYFDYAVTVRPTKDTTYTLTAERGSRDRECEVDIEVEDNIVVLQTRDQQPLVAGISLTEVPYTGFEAGTFASFLFYVLLVLWALYITYVFVIRKEDTVVAAAPAIPPALTYVQQAEAMRPDLFPKMASVAAPTNLPTTQKKSHLSW